MSIAQRISTFVEQMPEKNQLLVLELVRTMIDPDDILSEEDIADIKQAREEFARGEFVRHDEIDWN
jgi:hypothetical protein